MHSFVASGCGSILVAGSPQSAVVVAGSFASDIVAFLIHNVILRPQWCTKTNILIPLKWLLRPACLSASQILLDSHTCHCCCLLGSSIQQCIRSRAVYRSSADRSIN